MAIVKGRIRGGGRQLAHYLLSYDNNEVVRILDVDGQLSFTESCFKDLLTDFSRNERLTKSKQGVYHCIYRPPENVAFRLLDENWLQAADVLSAELGFADQRRAVVLHKKKDGSHHIHLAIERYNHERGIMMPIAFNYRKQDVARSKLEKMHNEKPTPRRNASRAQIKETLTGLWRQTADGASFIKEAKQHGYTIAKAYEKGQYVVVDQTARSFKLVSHLDGIRTKEVRGRLDNRKLIGEKEAVAFASAQKAITAPVATDERQAFIDRLAGQRNKQKSIKPRMH